MALTLAPPPALEPYDKPLARPARVWYDSGEVGSKDSEREREARENMVETMDLDIDLSNPRAISAAFVRDLTEADLLVAASTPKGSTPSLLKKLNDKHHALARSLASGMDNTTAGIVTGYSASRISILKDDPAFAELLAFYRSNLDAVQADMHARMSTLSLVALEELAERLEDAAGDPDAMSNGMVLDIVKTLTDRTGFGPRTTQVNVNVDLAGRLSAARQRALAAADVKQISGVVNKELENVSSS